MRSLFSFLLFTLLFGACATKTPNTVHNKTSRAKTDGYAATSESGSSSTVQNNKANQSLDVYLSRTSGVNVTGSGARAHITIRGVSSFSTNNEPLFILDGQPMGSYSQVYNLLSPQEIKSVTVLKESSDTGIYGTRGANGVILILRNKAKD